MRLHHSDSTTIHLAYCTNVHPAETLDGITAQLTDHAEQVRQHLGTDLVGLGLWLPADVAHHLADHPADTAALRRALTTRGLETVTLNGFPYRGFHTPVVKRGVYFPDWSEPSRLTYTLNLAKVLAGLLPEDAARGSISTLPLAWRTPWTGVQRSTAAQHLDDLAAGLKQIEAETGRTIRVGLEPEPGCVAETTAQAARAIAGADHDWIGLCLDACHLAVQHEDPRSAVAALVAEGVPIVKLQASSALVADTPADTESREALRPFAEPRFLHQVREQGPDGTLHGSDDLAPALAGALPGDAPWRIHYHVPLHDQPEPPLRNTSDSLQETLRATLGGERALTDHIEVETYTWDVLPAGLRPTGAAGIAAGIATELEWTHGELVRLGLTEHGGSHTMTGHQVAVLCTVGLTPRLLGEMPHVAAIGQEGFAARLDTVFPAVTATVQATLTTGLLPRDHGAVANGWYHRDHGEVMMWRQHNALVGGEKVWQAARKQDPGHTTAYLCWWWAMGADVDTVLTPRPVYHYDGRKSPDCYTKPAGLRDELTARQGEFPLFNYWGPTASIASTRWIAGAARHVVDTRRPDLSFIYVPHLDYDLQRYGPDSPQAVRAAREADAALAPLLGDLRDRGTTVVALSEYGISPVSRPVDINRALRREGLLSVYSQRGMEYLDPCTSRAFAVADHQAAHVYVADPADIPRVRDVLKHTEGVDEIWDRTEQATYGIDHPSAGELVAVAEPDAWFTYYYWLDDTRAPDFARGVEIHRKPGFDPAELFFDPADKAVKAKAALTLLRKKAGMRAPLTVVPLDPAHVRGSHGRLPQDHRDGPLLLCSDPGQERDRYHATEVKDLLLRLNGLA